MPGWNISASKKRERGVRAVDPRDDTIAEAIMLRWQHEFSAVNERATRRRQLKATYGSDAALGARYDEEENLTLLPNGTSAATCTNYARLIRSLEPNTAVWGFSGDANPESAIGQVFFGQDFAVVDGRYIVDPWVVERAGMSERAVFDLEDPTDAAEICRLYGDRSKWKQMYPPLRFDSREDRADYRPSTEYRGRVSALPPR